MPIKYHTIPEECHAQIFFKEGGWTGEEWQAEIEATGEIIAVVDKDGKRYTTSKELDKAGIERFTLINHHVVEILEDATCDFCEAPLVECFDQNHNEFYDCSDGCEASEGHYT